MVAREFCVSDLTMAAPQPGSLDRADHGALFASLYDELRGIAHRELRRGGGLTLSATTLLHETYFRIRQRDLIELLPMNRRIATSKASAA